MLAHFPDFPHWTSCAPEADRALVPLLEREGLALRQQTRASIDSSDSGFGRPAR
jgi:hypothetical protein